MGELAEKCIASWREKLPDYSIQLWNEDNFDVSASVYCKEAYGNRKFAFVSDYARFWILKHHGGIYLDVDYEMLKPFSDEILDNQLFMGLDEIGDPTAIVGAAPNHPYNVQMVELYNNLKFVNADGSFNDSTMNVWMEDVLKRFGYKKENSKQVIDHGIALYPDDYFQAKSLLTGKFNITSNTYTIHHHTLLWVSSKTKLIKFLRTKILVPVLGSKRYLALIKLIKR